MCVCVCVCVCLCVCVPCKVALWLSGVFYQYNNDMMCVYVCACVHCCILEAVPVCPAIALLDV